MLGVQTLGMAKTVRAHPKPTPRKYRRHFIKEWRVFRHLTQEQLAERVGMSPNNLSQLENYRQGYSHEGLERLADALNCEPGQLLMVDPSKDDGIWSIWEKAKPGERQQIVAVARALVAKTGT